MSLFPRSGPLWPDSHERVFGVGGVPEGVEVIVRRRQLISRPGESEPLLGPWKDAKEHTVDGVALDRMSSSEIDNEAGTTTLQTWTLRGPAAADILEGDRVVFPDGTLVQVEGVPAREANVLNGWIPPMSVTVKATRG